MAEVLVATASVEVGISCLVDTASAAHRNPRTRGTIVAERRPRHHHNLGRGHDGDGGDVNGDGLTSPIRNAVYAANSKLGSRLAGMIAKQLVLRKRSR